MSTFLTFAAASTPPRTVCGEQAVEEIATVVGQGDNPPIICGLARALTKDIDVSVVITRLAVVFTQRVGIAICFCT